MLELLHSSLEKFIQQFIVNLSTKIQPITCRKVPKIKFVPQVDKELEVTKEILCISEKLKDAAVQANLDCFSENSVQQYLERKTGLLNKHIYQSSPQLLTSHMRHMNRKILQRIIASKPTWHRETKHSIPTETYNFESSDRKIKRNITNVHGRGDAPENKIYVPNMESDQYPDSNLTETQDQNKNREKVVDNNCKIMRDTDVSMEYNSFEDNVQKTNSKVMSGKNRRKRYKAYTLVSGLPEHTKTEIRYRKQFLSLCAKDDEFKKRNVHITLYIYHKELQENNSTSRIKPDRVISLCQRAILCLIEPSEKAFVIFREDLSSIIENHLSQGYKTHFENQSNNSDSYVALLILSQWAKVLIKNQDATVIHAISHILHCATNRILILSCPYEK